MTMTQPVWAGRFDGRVMLITGALGGLGSAAAARLEAEGATVVRTDLKVAADDLAAPAPRVALDVTEPHSWSGVVDTLLARFGRIDGLLMCHGAQGPEAPVGQVPVDGWQRTLDINLTGCFLGLRAVVPAMTAAGYGRIAVLASIAGREGNENMAAYSAAKAGVIALVKSVAKETATASITVNAVVPALMQTPLLDHLSPERNAMLLERIPMGRTGTPAEFAAMAAWLLSAECSFTTGQGIDLSGGRYTG
ncbi:SDR family NAD(P)-dependent oxidoreductase [Microbacterium sp.]|uniref:SDR family NAD(P)-dependent oxidoreductase n=1 Tax=Microbacterium sp. TaxID=51671 RepID=UPI003A8711B2